MEFTKMQGAANDFVLIETGGRQADWPRMAVAMCDRHLGIGADSLLLLEPSDKADYGMRTFDADGSEAEICGNGIRCLAKYIYEKGLVSRDVDEISVETAAGIKTIRLIKEGGKLALIKANMGKPALEAERIPLNGKPAAGEIVDINGMNCYKVNVAGHDLELNCVSMGNPHAVHFIKDSVKEFPLEKLGSMVEHLPVFPKRVNFEVARVLGQDRLEARVWERGVGETMACGSGACAITVASQLRGLTQKSVQIELLGGVLTADWNGNGEVILGGPAEFVYTGIWPD